MPERPPLDHVGQFKIGTLNPGAPFLSALLTVPQNSDSVTGSGVLTQAISPPLRAETAFNGFVAILVNGPQTTQVFTLQGVPFLPIVGPSYVTHLLISLKEIWGNEGTATYTYVNGSKHHEVKNVPVTVKWLPQE
jgi:Domain of unknown function (DUF1842)